LKKLFLANFNEVECDADNFDNFSLYLFCQLPLLFLIMTARKKKPKDTRCWCRKGRQKLKKKERERKAKVWKRKWYRKVDLFELLHHYTEEKYPLRTKRATLLRHLQQVNHLLNEDEKKKLQKTLV
jgi:hypothetical protein